MKFTLSIHILSVPIICGNADPFWMVNKHDYCGRSEIPAYKARTDTSATVGLKSVHVLLRHGARSEYESVPCFADNKQTKYKCDNSSLFSLDAPKSRSIPEFPEFQLLAKVYEDESDTCAMGQLLDEGIDQLKRVGKYLMSTYPIQFACDNKSRMNLYSTDTQRTMASLTSVISSMYPNPNARVFKVNTRPLPQDHFGMNNPTCTYFKHHRSVFRESRFFKEFQNGINYAKCASLWNSTFKTSLDLWHASDCLLAPTCAKVMLPDNQPIPPALFECVTDLTMEIRAEEYGAVPSSPYFATGRTLCDINSFKILRSILKSAFNNYQVAGIYTLHDESLVCLLTSLGMWDLSWPKYAMVLAFEFYSDKSVRVMRDGLEIGILRNGLLDALRIKNTQQWNSVCQISS